MRGLGGLVVAMLSGCAPPLVMISSSRFGARQTRLKIDNESLGLGSRTRIVSCRGKLYYCSSRVKR